MSDDLTDARPEPQPCHTWLHIGGPLDGQVQRYPADSHPPVSLHFVRMGPGALREPYDLANGKAVPEAIEVAYTLETVKCGEQKLTVYKFSGLTLTEMFASLLRHYSPASADMRAKLLELMGKGVSDWELQNYVQAGFGIREIMDNAQSLRQNAARTDPRGPHHGT
jgi:hypothetical protein